MGKKEIGIWSPKEVISKPRTRDGVENPCHSRSNQLGSCRSEEKKQLHEQLKHYLN